MPCSTCDKLGRVDAWLEVRRERVTSVPSLDTKSERLVQTAVQTFETACARIEMLQQATSLEAQRLSLRQPW